MEPWKFYTLAQGYYFPAIGPANTMYIPGPLLRACNNELVLLELGNSMVADRAPTGVHASLHIPTSFLGG